MSISERLPLVRRLLIPALAVAAGAFLPACAEGGGTEAQTTCERLRDHVIDIRVGSLPDSVRGRHADNLQTAIGARLVADCQERPERHRDCALQADTMSELRRCGTPSLNSPTE